MKRRQNFYLFFLILLSSTEIYAIGGQPYWKDVKVVSKNKEYPRTVFMCFDNEKDALDGNFKKSPYYKLLNGVWNFYYVDAYNQISSNFMDSLRTFNKWGKINVPGNWEVQGYGIPIYTNHGYEFKPRNPHPPLLPEENPVGIYYRDFVIPENWSQRDIFLNISGAKSGVYVYLNGVEVGYNEDSKNPAEFLINQYVQKGKNTLVLKIFRWSTGSYLECQDFWRMSGIERDVYLFSQSKVSIKDFQIVSSLDSSYVNGLFNLKLEIKNKSCDFARTKISYQLLDDKKQVIASSARMRILSPNKVDTFYFKELISNVKKWSSEDPSLYKLLIKVEEEHKQAEIIPFNVGFRSLEIKKVYLKNGRSQNLFLVNGQAIKLKGVNLHEHNPKTGHYVPEELMRHDLELMKRCNINSIRLAHYPQDRRLYELCDEYGFYIYDEANIESHGMYYDLKKGGTLGNNPDWLIPHMDRTINMYERNKNYPSLTIWSLGNEAGNGYNFYQTYTWLKKQEAMLMNRPINYERAQWEWNSDMYVPQYPRAQWLEYIGKIGSDRPVVPSEYSHAMGNSNGNLWDQWKAIYKYPNLQGGYLWDWVDQGLLDIDSRGKPYWTYGGDYGINTPSDGNFLCNGIVNPDREFHPAAEEVKYAHQNITFEQVNIGKGEFNVCNRFYFTNLNKYLIRCIITGNGKIIRDKQFTINVEPQQIKTFRLSIDSLKPIVGVEYFINFTVLTKEPENLLPVGYVLAKEQFRMPIEPLQFLYEESKGEICYIETEKNVNIYSSQVAFTFDKRKGVVTCYKVKDIDLFRDGFGLQPNFWRAPTDNDYGNDAPSRLQIWKESSKNFKIVDIEIKKDSSAIHLKVDYLLAAGNIYSIRYKVYSSGIVVANLHFESTGKDGIRTGMSEMSRLATFTPGNDSVREESSKLMVPRIGVRFRLPKTMNKVSYFGKGPEENYCDRNAGSMVGLYHTTAAEMYYPYVRPQENGHRTETRWLSLQAKDGKGILIKSTVPIEFNALHNSIEDFDAEEQKHLPRQWNNFSEEEVKNRSESLAKNKLRRMHHINDILPQDFVEVCLDMKQQGVAGYNSWGVRPDTGYDIPANQNYSWNFTIVPINGAQQVKKAIMYDY